jgi:protein SSD1
MDAFTAAREGAKRKEKELGNVESLQKMITDLKSIPQAGNVNLNDRRTSVPSFSSPMSIPSGEAKLKPDAQPFTPSSPVNPLASPTGGFSAESAILKNRSSFAGLNTSRHSGQADVGGNFDALLRQQEEAKLALEQQMALQRLQAQQASASGRQNAHRSSGSIGNTAPQVAGAGGSGNLPPRFQRTSVRNQPLYEESALDDENEITYNSQGMPQLAPAFNIDTSARHARGSSMSSQREGVLNESFRMPQAAEGGAGNEPSATHDRSSMGINAGMLAGIAARAHQRTGSELNPLMAEQLQIQRQIELLQEQQRLLLQQQSISQPSALANLGNMLRNNQNNSGGNANDFSRDLQEQYVQALHAQQMQIQAQAQALAQAQAQQASYLNQQRQQQQHRPSQPSLNDFSMPSFNANNSNGRGNAGHIHRPSSASNDINNPARSGRQGSDAAMVLPPIPAGGNLGGAAGQHRRRNSAQTHRPANSIIGSFGGFVSDVDDMPPLPPHGGHNRTGSRSAADNWRSGNVNQGSTQGGMDLAQAQAQLQLLTNFRSSQGVGGHHKMASFNFPNLLPNLHVAQTLGPSSQSLVQQQQAFQMQLQQSTGPGPQRKSLFAPYLPHGSLPALLAAGKLVVGSLRVNKRNRSDAYVATDVLDADIYICGSKDRNRALEGDIVAVELLDVDEVWNAKKEKEEKKRKKEENSAYDQGISKAASRKNDKKKDDVEVEGQGLVLFEEEEVTDEQKPTYAGHVVAVVERMTGQLFSGQLGVLRPSSAATKEKQEAERRERDGNDRSVRPQEQRPKIVWFKPTDKRVPLIAIPTEQAPGNFLDDPEAYVDKLFVATIKRWPITSLHPFGSLVEELGTIGDLETETAALLKDCNFPTEDFPEAVTRCLPPTPWVIPEREYALRRDMREERVFTIDPETAKDLDDALSIKALDDGTYEVGVHIADVSYFGTYGWCTHRRLLIIDSLQ